MVASSVHAVDMVASAGCYMDFVYYSLSLLCNVECVMCIVYFLLTISVYFNFSSFSVDKQ